MDVVRVSLLVNGQPWEGTVFAHRTLLEIIREDLFLTGTKLSCNQAVCGACTVLVDGQPVASCSTFGFQADGAEIQTVEGLSETWSPGLSEIQEAFARNKAFQCGFCTPGMLMTARALLSENPQPDRNTVQHWLTGNVCRCTGYGPIIEAILEAGHRATTGSDRRFQ